LVLLLQVKSSSSYQELQSMNIHHNERERGIVVFTACIQRPNYLQLVSCHCHPNWMKTRLSRLARCLSQWCRGFLLWSTVGQMVTNNCKLHNSVPVQGQQTLGLYQHPWIRCHHYWASLSENALSHLETQQGFRDNTPVEAGGEFAYEGILIKELCMSQSQHLNHRTAMELVSKHLILLNFAAIYS
jgi:hypothetical protein